MRLDGPLKRRQRFKLQGRETANPVAPKHRQKHILAHGVGFTIFSTFYSL